MTFQTIRWNGNSLSLLDQRKLPHEEIYIEYNEPLAVISAIKSMVVRGAPAIGVTAAFGLALASLKISTTGYKDFKAKMDECCTLFIEARPTAVNLKWAVMRIRDIYSRGDEDVNRLKYLIIKEAESIYDEDIKINIMMGDNGEGLIENGDSLLTICNAGALATAGFGTALGVFRSAFNKGKKFMVYACETRPFLQGARLTAWELMRDNIPVTLITDNMAGFLMSKKMVNKVFVGADRVARNGDTANKIGTYTLAILAKAHNIPFYVVAPLSTFDKDCKNGEAIVIEERDSKEVTEIFGLRIAPIGVNVFNPAFDITPGGIITGFVTEKGIINPPF